MDRIKKIAMIDNVVQAQMLESLLKEQDIPHMMKSYHDSAYDGLFQGQKGWGHVEAPERYEPDILAILDDLRSRKKDDPPQESHD